MCVGLFGIGSFLAMGVFEYRSLFGKEVGGLRSSVVRQRGGQWSQFYGGSRLWVVED
ncbi:unnamed protein product [Camellia sinensis]